MLPLNAERNLPADEAYVESKNTVQPCEFKEHVLLGLVVVWMVVIFVEGVSGAWDSSYGMFVLFVFLQPFLVGLLASAYRQPLRVEAHQQEQHVVEMRDELKTARDMQLSLLPSEDPELDGYALDDTCEIINRDVQEVERHIGDAPQSDDISLIALKRAAQEKTDHQQTQAVTVQK